jgi:hypothetical protein
MKPSAVRIFSIIAFPPGKPQSLDILNLNTNNSPSPWRGEGWGGGGEIFLSAVEAHFHHPPPNPLPSQGGGFLMIHPLIQFDRIYT